MNRREAIKRVGLLMGGAMSMSTVTAVMSGCRVGPATPSYTPRTLSAEQDELVATLAELIIPETDTPGARAARVNEFADLMLTDWYQPAETSHFLTGLADVDARTQQAYGVQFVEATPEQQTELLTVLEDEAYVYQESRQERTQYDEFGREAGTLPEEASDETNREPANRELERKEIDEELEEAARAPFFFMMKELTLAGYYTSEIGATQELRDMPFGTYDGAVPYAEIGRAWS